MAYNNMPDAIAQFIKYQIDMWNKTTISFSLV